MKRSMCTPITLQTLQESKVPKGFSSSPFSYHSEHIIHIDDVTNLGVGVGRINGWVVMVPMVLPGEVARVRVYRNNKNYSEADLIEIVTPSAERVTPKCQYYETCNGCQYQHMSYKAQLSLKKKHVETALTRIGSIQTAVNEVVESPQITSYRSKITPHFSYGKKSLPSIGFQSRLRRNVNTDIENCLIATDAVNQKLKHDRVDLIKKYMNATSIGSRTMLLREGDDAYVETDPRANILQTVNNVTFEFRAGEFFQTNIPITSLLVNYVLLEARRNQSKFLIDAYCGSGLFSLCGAQHFESVYGVEVSKLAIENAIANCKRNKIENAHFLSGDSESIFSRVKGVIDPDEAAMIIDPPRRGCDVSFLRQLLEYKPSIIVYVSCEPTTQARDSKYLIAGGYEVVNVTPFDMFPQTRHLENVMTFSRIRKDDVVNQVS